MLIYFFFGFVDHDTNAEVHERQRELDRLLAHERDGETGYGQVGLVTHQLADHAVPVAAGVFGAELFVLDQAQLVCKVDYATQLLGQVDTEALVAIVSSVVAVRVRWLEHEERRVLIKNRRLNTHI